MADFSISYDKASLIINGRREFIRSGAMHYFRLPSQDLWRDRLFKLKAAGYNAVDLYFSWAYHSSAPGEYDFSGIRDVSALLEIARELGLYVIARPGPYINAETSGGGFPGWLLARKDLTLRHRRADESGAFEWSDVYMAYVREWWERIIPRINASSNVILLQIENEYATHDMEPDYIRVLYDLARQLGVRVPLFHNDLYVAGLYEDIVDIYAFDNYSVTQFESDWRHMPEVFQVLDNIEANLRPFCQNRPLMAAELQAGWYGGWKGYKYERITELLGREHIAISTKSLLAQGLTIFNHYKAIGGTNWDYIGSVESYTSYDFGAPISEAGLNTERLFESKAINQFLTAFDWTHTERCVAFPARLSDVDCFYAARYPADAPESVWLFLRNLKETPDTLTVDERYTVSLKPFEAQILPWRIQLKSGVELAFSTSEPLYQTSGLLVMKADRPVTLALRSPDRPLDFEAGADASGVVVPESDPGGLQLACPELPRHAFRHVRVGPLHVLFLGAALVDTFWIEEDGQMVMGPEMRLPKGYALAAENSRWWTISADGASVVAHALDPAMLERAAALEPPVLRHWELFDDAPELWRDSPVITDFHPVSSDSPDFDANGLYEGNAWYRLSLRGACPERIEIDARHIWAAFLNGRFIGEGQHLVLIYGMEAPHPVALAVPESAWRVDDENELLIFTDGLGHPKGFHDDGQTPQGLLSLRIDGENRASDMFMAGSVYSRRKNCARSVPEGQLAGFERSPIVRMRTRFSLPESGAVVSPWGVRLSDIGCERIDLVLNGTLIGRYWQECQCQELFYLPPGLLHTEPGNSNTLELILMNFQPFIEKTRLRLAHQQVVLHPYDILVRTEPESR